MPGNPSAQPTQAQRYIRDLSRESAFGAFSHAPAITLVCI